jgi:hypothetical protein
MVVSRLCPGRLELDAFDGRRGGLVQTHRLEQLADALQADLHGQHQLGPSSQQSSPCRAAWGVRQGQARHADAGDYRRSFLDARPSIELTDQQADLQQGALGRGLPGQRARITRPTEDHGIVPLAGERHLDALRQQNLVGSHQHPKSSQCRQHGHGSPQSGLHQATMTQP